MKQTSTVKQTTRLAPQQLQIATLIQASNEELEQLIRKEAEENFALDLVDQVDVDGNQDKLSRDTDPEDLTSDEKCSKDDYMDSDNESFGTEDDDKDFLSDVYVDDDYEPSYPVSSDNEGYSPILNYRNDESFRQSLLSQLDVMELTEEEDFLARYLVGSLNDYGYLNRPLKELVEELADYQDHFTSEEELERVLTEVVQVLEPIGIGARDLRECLLLQIEEKKASPVSQLAYAIVDRYFEDLAAHRKEKICQRLECSQSQFGQAYRLISHLVAKPAGVSADTDQMETKSAHVKADFRISVVDGKLKVSLYNNCPLTVRVSSECREMLDSIQRKGLKSNDDKVGLAMLKEKIAAGNQFIDSLAQRKKTLSNVIEVIAKIQQEFFLSSCDPDLLKPMVLQDVANLSGYDISTISRVSNSKYIETDSSIIAVKDLFTAGIQTEHGVVSNTAVMECLRDIIEEEDKNNPYSDDTLATQLANKGYKVARRTVSKYREILKYPSAKERKQI